MLLVIVLNILYKYEVIDPTNKAYGLNYSKQIERADYSRQGLLALCTPEKTARDKQQMIQVLENWKEKAIHPKALSLHY